jgi:hypothetical protein
VSVPESTWDYFGQELEYKYKYIGISQPALHAKTVGGVSQTNDVPYIEYVLSFLKMTNKVQQPGIF